MTAVALPLWLALLGVVLRGAGFAFRKEVTRSACACPARRSPSPRWSPRSSWVP